MAREVESRSFYGADDRLRVHQTYDVRRTDEANYTIAGVWEEYRYDALGRRVLLRTRADGGLCDVDPWTCTSSVTHFVWSGDNLLWELKKAEGSYAAQAGGNVSYFHAGGIDRPLVITKGSESIIPHQNWRGQFARGTYPNGCKSDCPYFPAPSTCTPIQWPGERTSARHELEPDGRIQNWHGGLVDGMRDASGQMYMRNRYYDPQTGQFTQTDPIGLAGGLNSYGYVGGDPINFHDPFGLCRQYSGFLGGIRTFFSGRCSSVEQAATRGMRRNYQRSVQQDVEYGGEVVSRGSGFRYTQRRGTECCVSIDTNARGYEAAWHTHGGPNPRYDSENFSDADRDVADNTEKPIYVVTPSGRMKRYDPDPNKNRQGPETETGQIQ